MRLLAVLLLLLAWRVHEGAAQFKLLTNSPSAGAIAATSNSFSPASTTTPKPSSPFLFNKRFFQMNGTNLSFIIPAITFFPYLRRFIPSFFTSETVQGRGFNTTSPSPAETADTPKLVVGTYYISGEGTFCSLSHQGTWRDLSSCSQFYSCRPKPFPPPSCGPSHRPFTYFSSNHQVEGSQHSGEVYENGCVQLATYRCKEGWVYDQNKGKCGAPNNEEDRLLCSEKSAGN